MHFHLGLALAFEAVLFVRFSAAFAGMIHEVTHRPLFTRRFRLWARGAVEWLICPLFGMSPYLYAAQHAGMHHPESNLDRDASSTLRYRRDSPLHFARYFVRFLVLQPWELLKYLHATRKTRLLRHAAFGLAAHHAAIAIGLWLHPRATLVLLVLPVFWMRHAFAAGNWAQHAFIDPEAPADSLRSVITCVAPGFNRLTFNSGFHAAHHGDLRIHWSALPKAYEQGKARYAAQRAVVFEGIDYGHVFFALMFKRYRYLAERHADFGEERSVVAERLRCFTAPLSPGRTPASCRTAIAG
jgi:fatty acid desaturase